MDEYCVLLFSTISQLPVNVANLYHQFRGKPFSKQFLDHTCFLRGCKETENPDSLKFILVALRTLRRAPSSLNMATTTLYRPISADSFMLELINA